MPERYKSGRPLVSDTVLIYCRWRNLQDLYERAERFGQETSQLDDMEAEILDCAIAIRGTSDFDRAMQQVIAFECGMGDLHHATYLKLKRLADDYIEAVGEEIDSYSAKVSGNWIRFVVKWDNICYLG